VKKRKIFLYVKNSILVCLERWLAEKFSLKTLYFVGYFVYTIGCMVNFFVHQVVVNIIMCFTCKLNFSSKLIILMKIFLVGMLVVSLNTLPYHMLSQFHTDDTVKINFLILN